MDKELVEMQVRIFSENVTLRVFHLLACSPRPSPTATRLALANFYSKYLPANAKSPQHRVLRASPISGP